MESVALDERSILELDDLSRIVVDQTNREIMVSEHEQEDTMNYHVETECQAPEVCTEFQTARLVLNHLGYFNPNALKESITSPMPRIVALDSQIEDFYNDMAQLDDISAKTVDNIYIYYVKNGQKQPSEILNNVSDAISQKKKSHNFYFFYADSKWQSAFAFHRLFAISRTPDTKQEQSDWRSRHAKDVVLV